jgi:hypothetical protein
VKISSNYTTISKVFVDYCNSKHYQVRESEETNNLRLDISNLTERTIVKIYTSSTIQIQGKQNSLRKEMEQLKADFEANPQSFLGAIPEIKACATRYDIMLSELRTKIREALNTLDATVEIAESSRDAEYRAKLTRNDSSLTITQFNNGTLLLQGKTDKLFHDSCDLVEKVANPSNKDVVARFISSDEESLKLFSAKYTPELTEIAERNVIQKIGRAYDFLEPYDKKYFVAAESLFLANIPLPEYSPIVMPASKAFEGLAKKIVVAIGLGSSGSTDFSILNSRENPTRKSICSKETHCDTFLCDLNVAIKKFRHFMMHSDTSNVTKVDSYNEAKEKLEEIYKESKKFFDYFNSVFKLLP